MLTALFRALKVSNGTDITRQSDYFADIGDPGRPARRLRGASRSTELWQISPRAQRARRAVTVADGTLHATTRSRAWLKVGRKRRARKKKGANHGKRPNA